MKILYIAPFQHPALGGSARCYYFVRELARRHSITLLSLSRTEIPPQVLSDVASCTKKVLTVTAHNTHRPARGGFPFRLPRAGRSAMNALRLRRAVYRMKDVFLDLVKREAYDVVIFHGKDNFAVIDGWSERPIVADVCDATTQRLWQGLRYAPLIELPWRTLRYLEARRIERKLLQQTPHQIFISPRDRSYMPGVSPRSHVIPNGIDLAYWTRKTDLPDTATIVFTGVMSYAPNVDGAIHLLKQTLPHVRQFIPLHQVLIVGRDPSSSLKEAARAYSDVRVTGFVDDVRPYLEQAAVFVAPLRYASGMQNKVLEAMAMRVPVVTTSSVAKGLRVEGNGDPPLLLAEGEGETAEQIIHLLRNRAARLQLADEGRRYVENHFDWSRSASMLEQACVEAVSQGRRQEKAGDGQTQTAEAEVVAAERQSVGHGYRSQ